MAKDMKTINIKHEDGRMEKHTFDANERRRKIAQAKREAQHRSVASETSETANEQTEYDAKGTPVSTKKNYSLKEIMEGKSRRDREKALDL